MSEADSKTYREYEVLIKDRMWLLMWAPGRRSDYYYAKIKVGIKKYAYRSLKTDNKDLATEKAFDVYTDVINQVKKTGSSSPLTVRSLCNKWIKQKQDRYDGGNLSLSLMRAHRNVFTNFVPNYCDAQGWKAIKDIPQDGWIGYRKWRSEEGWKFVGLDENGKVRSGTNLMRRPPKGSTINREITMIQEWYRYMLVPEKLAASTPEIHKTKQKRDEKTANVPFTREDYTKIQRRFRKWANEKNLTRAQKSEWRVVVYNFFLCSASVGWRPDSEGLEMRWKDLKIRERQAELPNGGKKTEVIAHLDIWDRKNSRQRSGNFLGGEYFVRLKDFYEKLHKENPTWHKPNLNSFIFCDPSTGKRLNYNSVFNAYKKVLMSLGMKDTITNKDGSTYEKFRYSFYSCRSFYVNERLREGVEIFTVAKQTGHSVSVCEQFYAALQIQLRADEATKRTYGVKKQSEGELLFD